MQPEKRAVLPVLSDKEQAQHEMTEDPAGIFELVELVGNGTYGQVYKKPTLGTPNGWYTGDFAVTRKMAFVLRETNEKGNTTFLLFSCPVSLLHSSPMAECLGYVNVFHHSVDLPGLPEHVIAFLSLPLALSLICPSRPPLPTSLSSHLQTSCWLFDRPPGRVLHRNLSCSLSSSEASDMRSRHKSA
ncbi:Traf2 and NCK-interacting protein kinase [Anabarilius grahami]|uniref:Traf2 and NCK-interacting protein kinase n=1 Tax=Anabarilius grahami TaxID=495550 RepID=A0A3N0YFP9_ANAGA|nr:Traf2 and NCK-interacting protein kinase [Anabarilius grahami]